MHRDITRMLEEYAYNSRKGLLVSEESLQLSKALDKDIVDVAIPKPTWWLDGPSEFYVPLPPASEHFRMSLRYNS